MATFFSFLISRVILASDEEGDVAVVLQHVALENVGAGTEDTLEPRAVQFDALQRPAGSHGGGARPVEQQRDLAEVLGRTETTDFHRISTLVADLMGNKIKEI